MCCSSWDRGHTIPHRKGGRAAFSVALPHRASVYFAFVTLRCAEASVLTLSFLVWYMLLMVSTFPSITSVVPWQRQINVNCIVKRPRWDIKSHYLWAPIKVYMTSMHGSAWLMNNPQGALEDHITEPIGGTSWCGVLQSLTCTQQAPLGPSFTKLLLAFIVVNRDLMGPPLVVVTSSKSVWLS